MFTGIITHLGKLYSSNGLVLAFNAEQSFCKKLKIGTSVAINGVCLTIFKKPTKDSFSVEVMPETRKKTMLAYLKVNDIVNLELPLTPQAFLSGHIVQGHIDGIAKLLNITREKNSHILKFSIPKSLSKFIAEKGSITVNGISLTVIEAGKTHFTVGIITYTWNNTMLNTLKTGNLVNIETDILAKYTERLLKQ